MRKLFVIGIALLISVLTTFAQARFWGELWSNHNYAYNNLSDQQTFLLNSTVLRAGARLFLSKDTFTLALDPYVETQLVLDAFNARHPNVYNLHFKPAAGLKLNYRYYNAEAYFQFLEVDLYTEYRRLLNLSDQTEEQYKQISTYDLVGGIKIWGNSDNRTTIGFELWCDLLSYRLTNFALSDEHNYLINTLSPVLLIRPFTYKDKSSNDEIDYLQQLALYLNPEVTMDLLPKEYNENPYSNRFLTRLGVRWVWPIRFYEDRHGKKYINLQFYMDYTMVYWKETNFDWDLPSEDFRAGLMIYIPFGNNKMKKWRI